MTLASRHCRRSARGATRGDEAGVGMDVARHGVNCRVSLGVQHTLLSVLVCLSTSFGRTCLTVLCFELAHTCACLTSKRKTTGNQSEVDIAQPLALSRLVCLAALRWCLPRMGRTPLFASPPFHLQLQLDFSPHYTVDFSEAACEAEGWLWVPLDPHIGTHVRGGRLGDEVTSQTQAIQSIANILV